MSESKKTKIIDIFLSKDPDKDFEKKFLEFKIGTVMNYTDEKEIYDYFNKIMEMTQDKFNIVYKQCLLDNE